MLNHIKISLLLLVLSFFFVQSSYSSSGVLIIKTDVAGVLNGEIATVKITPKSMILYRGGCMQFVATAYDSKGKKVPFALHWEIKSDIPGFGNLDRNEGDKVIFNAVNAGTGTLEAVNGGIKAVIPVEIRKPGGGSR